MIPVPARCSIDHEGRVRGPLTVTFNDPWPCANGQQGFSRPARGVVLHTEVGTQAGTIAWFNNAASSASAHFAVDKDGAVHQFGPVGHGWMAWAEEAGNDAWYSVEDADGGDPSKPFTAAQMQSLALLIEVLARHDGFPLRPARDPFTERGVALHSEGGSAWGGHPCPGPVRGAQRPHILAMARGLRHTPRFTAVAADGKTTLAAVAALYHTAPSTILRLSAEHGPSAPELAADLSGFVNGVFGGTSAATDPVPAGVVLIMPAH